ncbi:MAG: hypothetical protein WA126_02380 [Thermodesulfovibrionales bacterium]
MFDKAIAIGILILIGFALHYVLKKVGVRITIVRILFIWVFGALLTGVFGGGLLFYLGIIIMVIATALFFFNLFVTIPNKNDDAEFEKLLVKAKSGLLDESEAYTLLKKAIHYEARGQIEDAKVLYELIVRSNTSISGDAQSCLKNL